MGISKKKLPGDRFGFRMKNDPLVLIETKDKWADQSSRLGSCKGREGDCMLMLQKFVLFLTPEVV